MQVNCIVLSPVDASKKRQLAFIMYASLNCFVAKTNCQHACDQHSHYFQAASDLSASAGCVKGLADKTSIMYFFPSLVFQAEVAANARAV